MTLSLRNLDWVRKLTIPGVQSAGARLYELISDIKTGTEAMEQQTNSNMSGSPAAPPSLQGFNVSSHENGFDVSFEHNVPLYRGINYYVDYADNPHFVGARTAHIGESRNAVLPLGNRTLYMQGWAKYPNGEATPPKPFPEAVTGGTATEFLPSQGCGTSLPGQPPNQQPAFRSSTGAPPVRSTK